MKTCKNETCSQPSKTTYCCRRCQVMTRNSDHKVTLPDIRVGMDLERAIRRRAATLDVRVADLVLNLLEAEVGYDYERPTPAEVRAAYP